MSDYKLDEVQKRKVLIINTGGTIGSKYTDKGILNKEVLNILIAHFARDVPQVIAR